MADVRTNIFGIGEVYELQREGQWVEKNRESYREYGYFGPGPVNRIDYSNDTNTASIRGPISGASGYCASAGNYNYGWFAGGSPGAYVFTSASSRFDYSNDTAASVAKGPMSVPRYNLAAIGNISYGWFGGGSQFPVGTDYTRVDRIDYSNDSTNASIRGPLTLQREGLSATGNSNFGYFLSGSRTIFFSPFYTTVDRINYSNDTTIASIRGYIASGEGVRLGGATGNNNFGYFTGGSNPDNTYKSFVRRINYSNDTVTPQNRGNLAIPTSHCPGAAGNSNFGYFGTGRASPAPRSNIQRIDYSNDTVISSTRGPLSKNGNAFSATSSASFGGAPVSYLGAPWTATSPYGYFGGGAAPSSVSTIDRIDYTNDTTTASLRGPLTTSRSNLTATGNTNFGYYIGGLIPSPASVSIVDRIDYTNDTNSASTRGNLLVEDRDFSAAGNATYAYVAGGNAASTTIYRIQYSNDFAVTSRGTLTGARRYNAAVSSPNFAYFGGHSTVVQSTIDRLDYSNDSISTTIRGPLSRARFSLSATSTNNFGYFGGGSTPSLVSTVDRVDYSNDTATASIRGPLSVARTQLAATGSSTFGYFGGGAVPGLSSLINRVDYSNDTQIASARQGSLSIARNLLADSSSQVYGGAPNTPTDPTPSYIVANTKWDDSNTLDLPFKRVLGSYGYFGGGYATRTDVYRIDFSNDVAGISRRGNLSTGRRWHSAFSNRNFGYQNSGNGGIPERVDYSNDSSTARTRSYATPGYYHSAVSTNNEFAYHIPGASGSSSSTLQRLDYSNDNTLLTRGNLVRSINLSAGVGTKSFAYIAGNNRTWVQRLEYANDNARSVNRGNLEIATNWVSAQLGNSNFGYIVGGGSQVQRINYSNDLAKASIRGPLSSSSYARTGAGNFEFGWVGFNTPANTPGPGSQVDRIDYSNDLVSPQKRMNGSSIIYSIGMSNAKF